MKLAEALLEKADLQKRIGQMNERLNSNARVQEGEKPAEDPKALLAELEAMISRLEELTAQVNLTNSAVTVDGEPLTRLLARRDAWRLHTKMLRDCRKSWTAVPRPCGSWTPKFRRPIGPGS